VADKTSKWIEVASVPPPDDLWWRWVFSPQTGVTIAQWWPGPGEWDEVYNTSPEEHNTLMNVTHYMEIDWPQKPTNMKQG